MRGVVRGRCVAADEAVDGGREQGDGVWGVWGVWGVDVGDGPAGCPRLDVAAGVDTSDADGRGFAGPGLSLGVGL